MATALMRLTRAQRSIVEGQCVIFRVHDEMNKVGLAVGVMDSPGTTPQFEATAEVCTPAVIA